MNDGNGLAPISLAVECPVIHLILNTLFADALFCKEFSHLFNGILLVCEAVEEAGVNHFAVARISFNVHIAALDDFDDVDAELLCEFIVSLVVCGNSHNCARTVAHHNVVGNINRDFLAVDGVGCSEAFKLNARLILDELRSLESGFLAAHLSVSLNVSHIANHRSVLINKRMLGSHYHKGNAEESVGSGCVNLEKLLCAVNRKVNESTR